MLLRTGIIATPRKTAALALMALLILAHSPSVAQAQLVGPTAITTKGIFTDWTRDVCSQTDGYIPRGADGTKDITRFWYAMATANDTSPASSGNLIQNRHFRIGTSNTGTSPKHGYWVQLKSGKVPEPVNVALWTFGGVLLVVSLTRSHWVRNRVHDWWVGVSHWLDAV
jgi:hypothetical protein